MAPFVPSKPEKMIKAEISTKEASLIKILRGYSFGKFVVHKTHGVLLRIQIQDSQNIDDEGGLELAIE